MDKYIVAPPNGSTQNSVGAEDGKWQKGYFESLPNWQEYLAESTGYGIASGCEPTISGLTVTVGAGVVHLADGTRKEIASTNITLDSADASNPRIDLVYIDSTGAVAKVTGTAAASPSAPTLPSNGISVATVTVAANATAGTLTDVRGMLPRWYNSGVVNVKDFGAVGDGVTDDTAAIQAALDKTGAILLEPNHVYITTKPLAIPSNTMLYGNFATIKAAIKSVGDWESGQYSILHNKNLAMNMSSGNRNIYIKNLTVDATIAKEHCGKHGTVQFRGVSNGVIDNVTVLCNGYDNWGINIFSTNQHITVSDCTVINSANEGTLGGCLWVRSGLAGKSDEYASFDINIDNFYGESTAVDELLCVCDAIDNTKTEVNFSNITLVNKTTSTHPDFLACIYALGSNSDVKVKIDNARMIGTCGNYAIGVNHTGSGTADYQATNVDINITGKGLYNGKYTNSIIRTTGQVSVNCDFDNCDIKGGSVYGGKLVNSQVESSETCCENCSQVINSTIKSTGSIGIKTFGGLEHCKYINNTILSSGTGILFQSNGTNITKNSIISGNIFKRSTNETSNANTYAINAYNSDYLVITNNIFYYKYTDGNYWGYRNTTSLNGSHNVNENNVSIESN